MQALQCHLYWKHPMLFQAKNEWPSQWCPKISVKWHYFEQLRETFCPTLQFWTLMQNPMQQHVVWNFVSIKSNWGHENIWVKKLLLMYEWMLDYRKMDEKKPKLMINSCSKIYGACRHRTRFHRFVQHWWSSKWWKSPMAILVIVAYHPEKFPLIRSVN